MWYQILQATSNLPNLTRNVMSWALCTILKLSIAFSVSSYLLCGSSHKNLSPVLESSRFLWLTHASSRSCSHWTVVMFPSSLVTLTLFSTPLIPGGTPPLGLGIFVLSILASVFFVFLYWFPHGPITHRQRFHQFSKSLHRACSCIYSESTFP